MKRKAKVNHHHAEWTFIGAAIVLGTMACSFSLPDISNLPRLAFLAAALAVTFLCSSRLRRHLPSTLGAVAFVLFVLLQAVSTLWAVNKGEAVYDTARWITVGALFLTVFHLYRRHPARTMVLLSRVAAIIILVSLAAAVRQTLQLNGDLRWDNRYSITSLYTHKGSFSLLLLMVTLPIVMRLRLRLRKGRTFYWLLLALAAATLLFLAARTSLLALAALGVVLLITLIPFKPLTQRWRIPAILILALLMGTFLLGGARLFTHLPLGDTPGKGKGVLSSSTILERHALWSTTLRLVDRHPLLGVGAGNWKVCYPEVSTRDLFSVDVLDFTFVRPHNDYLRVLAETGYMGFALLMIALASPVTGALGRTSRRRRTGRMTGTALAYFAAVGVAALVDFPFDRTELLLWSTVTVAILSASTLRSPLSAPRTPLQFFVALLLVAVAVLSLHRMGSERQYLAITAANHAQRWSAMEQAAHKARSPLCNLTPIGTPVAYYEAMAQEKQGIASLTTFAEALHDSPWHKQSLNDLGRLVYTVTHDADSAEVLFRRAIKVSPSFSYAWFNLAQLYLQEHQLEQAREVLLDYDLEGKQERITRLVWHYHQGETALYYQHHLVLAERQMRDQLLDYIDRLTR